jgi:hypothetical protein
LPSALGQLTDDVLIMWNVSFRERIGLTDEELALVKLSGLLHLDESYAGLAMENNDSQHFVRFVPCVLKHPITDEVVPGRALRRQDGMLLLLLELPARDVMFQEFIRGRLVGLAEERNRTRKFFHDLVSSQILGASFAAHAAQDQFTKNGAGQSRELARVIAALDEVIDAIAHGFDGQAIQTEAIPELEAASAQRLTVSISPSDPDKP